VYEVTRGHTYREIQDPSIPERVAPPGRTRPTLTLIGDTDPIAQIMTILAPYPRETQIRVLARVREEEVETMGMTTKNTPRVKLLHHEDDCGQALDGDGMCPRCKLHPDMQSTAFYEVPVPELPRGRTYLGEGRVPYTPPAARVGDEKGG
jgi:hypothetical protein